jgi:hypothetical protein
VVSGVRSLNMDEIRADIAAQETGEGQQPG